MLPVEFLTRFLILGKYKETRRLNSTYGAEQANTDILG